jgi:hypothetical protein
MIEKLRLNIGFIIKSYSIEVYNNKFITEKKEKRENKL